MYLKHITAHIPGLVQAIQANVAGPKELQEVIKRLWEQGY
jgi:hypothetical protein